MSAIRNSRSELRKVAFYLQYTCLMLIIVCFIVATRFQPDSPREIDSSSVQLMAEIANESDFGSLGFDQLFKENNKLDRDFAESLAVVLGEHDITASFQQIAGDDTGLEQSMSRVLVLAQFFSEQQLPAEAYNFQILDCGKDVCNSDSLQAEIKWLKAGE